MTRSTIFKALSALLFTVVLLTIGAGYYFNSWWNNPLSNEEKVTHIVKRGSSLSGVAYDLHRNGILKFPKLFTIVARILNSDQIRSGEYLVINGDTPRILLEKLNRGDVVRYQVTLVEGWTLKETLSRLHSQEKLAATLTDDIQLSELSQELQLEVEISPEKNTEFLSVEQKLEGWFFPDTYQYSYGMRDVDILRQAHGRLRDVLATEWESRDVNVPYKNAYEALIMASIVERETGVPQEREKIAGVFVRRLLSNMRLQTDPTVIYGLGDSYDGNLRRRHLSEPTPYNTYVIRGLPPTPIASAGRESIYAALHPDDGNSLYFVAKGDGSHYFSETLSEHNKAVQQYQILQRARNYQSAPNQSLKNR